MDPSAISSTERVPHGGETDPSVLDFSANVNPEIPDGVEEVYADALSESRRYPDDEFPVFRRAGASYVDCAPEHVIPTPGGLAAIRLTLETVLSPGENVLVPYPSFGEYAREVSLQGCQPVFVPHDQVLETERDDLETVSLVILCTPNNPTGEVADVDALEALIQRCNQMGTTVLVDEAFLGFTDVPSVATLGYEHVVVARSLTKLFGLPGLRAGFAVATGELGETLERARRAWTLGTPAARVGAYCLRQDDFIRESRKRIAQERAYLRDALESRFDIAPSDAPYLLCEPRDRTVSAVIETAREANIAIRDARTFRGLDAHVRIAVKNRTANERLIEAIA